MVHKGSNKSITGSSLGVSGTIDVVDDVESIREKSKSVVQPPCEEEVSG